ncbi:Ldh family oxidoreductase [Limosilactobacillus difficilis]|uniref:Ldh family oxidoreductase n=1 Tax=Limosilactobacillus difficilis TaxID=2991838 RepID=UPI0024BA70F5|nr:Ldh family oxidoreductase [Limosilactobacillus difficilis]
MSRIQAADERQYLEEVFDQLGFTKENGQLLADTLVDADLRGISSHGIQRLAWYRRMIKDGTIVPSREPKVVRELPGTVLVDANQNMGQIAANLAMDKVIDKAKKVGVGIGVVKNSNHFGIAGYYARKALQAGLVGIALTNTRPLVVPTNAREAFLGSNAFAFGFPASPHPFMFDGATSTVAGGKIQLADKKGEKLPGQWIVDKDRQLVKDPKQAEGILQKAAFSEDQEGGGLLTLGGVDEENSNYKGMGNSIVVELLTGILAQGSISADTVRGKHDFSQFVFAFDPSFFGDPEQLKADATAMLDRIRQLDHVPGKTIWVPGDREYKYLAENKQRGVSIDDRTFEEIEEIGQELGVQVPAKI